MFPAAPSGNASEKNPTNQKKIARSLSPGDLPYILLGTSRRAGCPHPAARLRCASCNPPVGADASVRPPGLYRISYTVSLRDQFANWSWQSVPPSPRPPCLKGTGHGEAVTGGFLPAPASRTHHDFTYFFFFGKLARVTNTRITTTPAACTGVKGSCSRSTPASTDTTVPMLPIRDASEFVRVPLAKFSRP